MRLIIQELELNIDQVGSRSQSETWVDALGGLRITLYYSLCFVILLVFGPGARPVLAHTQMKVDLTGKNVLVMHSGEANARIFLETDKGLSTTLESGGISERNLFFESLNLVWNPGPEYRKVLAEKLRLQYSHRKIDVIITMYPEALEFVMRDCKDIFPDAPIIALYLQKDIELTYADRTIVQHTATLDIVGTLEIALRLVPNAKRVYVVSGVHEVDRQVEAQARRDLKKWETRLDFHYLNHLPFEDMLTTVSSVPPDSILLLLVLVRDVKGVRYTVPTVAQGLSQVSAAPIFGIVDTGMGYGIVGGSLLAPGHIGSKAGELALDFLQGILPPGDAYKILKTPPVQIFDWRQLRRWDLSERALPEGSIIRNREFTIWDFKYHIIGMMAFCLLESGLIIYLLVQRRLKKAAEVSLRKAEEKYRSIFEGAVEGIFETSLQGQPLTVNPAMARILGYDSPGEFTSKIGDVGRQLYVDPDKRSELLRLIEELDVVRDFECEFLQRDGAKIWASISVRRVCGPDGKTLCYSGFLEDITAHKQVQEAFAEQLRFERMASDLSADFVKLSLDDIDSEINRGLRLITEFFDADRCSIGVFSEDGAQLVRAFDYHATGAEPAPESVSKEQMPWYMAQLIRGNPVVMNRVEDFPPEAQDERRFCLAKGMKSLLSLPLISRGKTLGSCAIVSAHSERVWPEHLFHRFRLVSDLFASVLERKKAEEASRQSDRILQQSEHDLRLLAGRLIHNQEEERSRLARELHDDLVQRLAVFAIDVGRLELELKDQPADTREKLGEMKKNIVKISGDVHNLSRRLHPSILDDLGLIRAIESQCIEFSKREGTDVVFSHENIHSAIPKDISLSLYRIIQEGLSNISKHACADHISISLHGNDHDILLSIQDDGIGFDSAAIKGKPGLGLSSIRERVRLFHGEHAIDPQPGKGTRITVRVPTAGFMKEES
ncbi:MAG: PAS domain S-box protein [Desulfatirhabdiaceae bacterium]